MQLVQLELVQLVATWATPTSRGFHQAHSEMPALEIAGLRDPGWVSRVWTGGPRPRAARQGPGGSCRAAPNRWGRAPERAPRTRQCPSKVVTGRLWSLRSLTYRDLPLSQRCPALNPLPTAVATLGRGRAGPTERATAAQGSTHTAHQRKL